MRPGEPSRMQATINVTPLVDVVLVLLIIFMVVAPGMMKPGPEVDLPTTARPPEQGDARDRLRVTIAERGALWITGVAVGVKLDGIARGFEIPAREVEEMDRLLQHPAAHARGIVAPP